MTFQFYTAIIPPMKDKGVLIQAGDLNKCALFHYIGKFIRLFCVMKGPILPQDRDAWPAARCLKRDC